MPHRRIAVIVAMSRELAPLLRRVRRLRADGVELFELETAVIAVGGIGRNAARRAAEIVIAKYAPTMIVSAGVAGALSPKLQVGEVVWAREVVDSGSGSHFAATGGESVIVTVSSVSGSDEKRMLAACWKADVVDMEAAAVAAVAHEKRVEFAAIKAISDEVGFVMPPVGRFVDGAGNFQTLRFAKFVVLRPEWWSVVRQLSANSRLAAVNLSEAVQHLIDQRSFTVQKEKIAEV